MNIDNDTLRVLFQAYTSSKKPKDRKRCPPSTAIASCFDPLTLRRKKKNIVDHITECSFCRDEFMLLYEHQERNLDFKPTIIRAAQERSLLGGYRSKRASIRLFQKYAYVLLGIGFIISSAIVLIVQQTEFSAVQRAKETNVFLLYPTSFHSLSENLVFRWQKQPTSQYYILELFDDALLPIWISEKTQDTSVPLPSEIQAKLQSGKSYYWMITAFSSISRTKESKLVRFLVLQKE